MKLWIYHDISITEVNNQSIKFLEKDAKIRGQMTMRFDEVVMAVFDRAIKPALAHNRLIIGENLSPFPSIKIAFDGYAEDEDGDDDIGSLSFVMYVHKGSKQQSFYFPEHKKTGWDMILSRDEEEVTIFGWFSSETGAWEVILTPEIDPNTGMTIEGITEILGNLT
jgi:hypothetical protein